MRFDGVYPINKRTATTVAIISLVAVLATSTVVNVGQYVPTILGTSTKVVVDAVATIYVAYGLWKNKFA